MNWIMKLLIILYNLFWTINKRINNNMDYKEYEELKLFTDMYPYFKIGLMNE